MMARSLASWSVVRGTLIVAFLLFLARSWLDWRYVFAEFIPADDATTTLIAVAAYVVLCWVWVWAIVAATRERRAGAWVALGLSGLLLVLGGLGTELALCPTPCATPLMDMANWTGFVVGGASAASAFARLRAAP